VLSLRPLAVAAALGLIACTYDPEPGAATACGGACLDAGSAGAGGAGRGGSGVDAAVDAPEGTDAAAGGGGGPASGGAAAGGAAAGGSSAGGSGGAGGPEPSKCLGPAAAKLVLCEGFEQPPDSNGWGVNPEMGVVGLDETHVRRGRHALRLRAEPGHPNNPNIGRSLDLAAPWYLRMFLWVPGDAPITDGTFAGFSDGNENNRRGVSISWTSRELGFDAFTGTVTATPKRTDLMYAGRWACVVMAAPDAAGPDLTLSLDGEQVLATKFADGKPPRFVEMTMSLGLALAAGAAPVDYWIDEIAIAHTSIGCDD
jgi:hypothetical protein